MSTGVTREDITRANDEITQGLQSQSQQEASPVGNNQNQWQKPITEYGWNNSQWLDELKASPYVGKIVFDPADWAESRHVVDVVMELLLRELRSQTEANYKGLRIDSYARQGSSRERLKVMEADEFDAIIEFHFDGLESKIEQTEIKNSDGFNIQGHCFLEIRGVDMAYLRGRYPTLYAKSVFVQFVQKLT